MRRIALALALGLFALAPRAKAAMPPFRACPYLTIGWSQQYPGPLTSVQYDASRQVMYVVFNGTSASAFAQVPLGAQQSFINARTEEQAQSVYQNQILPIYPSLLLAESSNCPLEYQNGTYIWGGNNGHYRPPFIPCPEIALGPQVRPGFYPPLYYQLGPNILYLDYGYGISKAYLNVPYNIVQQIAQLQDPTSLFNSLASTYQTILLSSPDNCPIKTPEYYLWTH